MQNVPQRQRLAFNVLLKYVRRLNCNQEKKGQEDNFPKSKFIKSRTKCVKMGDCMSLAADPKCKYKTRT